MNFRFRTSFSIKANKIVTGNAIIMFWKLRIKVFLVIFHKSGDLKDDLFKLITGRTVAESTSGKSSDVGDKKPNGTEKDENGGADKE